jgi:hypothetical protein
MDLTGNKMFYGRSKMMKKVLVLMLVLGLASAANAALVLSPDELTISDVGLTGVVYAGNDADGGYEAWVEISDPGIANFEGDPAFTEGGNPNGDSTLTAYPEYGAWYDFIVSSLSPDAPVVAGDHLAINLVGVSMGQTQVNLYADDGETLMGSSVVTVVPEPMTIALLGLGGLFLRRRK